MSLLLLSRKRPPAFTSTLTQWGVFEWTFTGAVEAVQSVLGDWFVKGPVTLSAISPAPTGTGESARNGAMVNPTDHTKQGYDGRAYDGGSQVYDETLNVGLDLPLTLNPGDSLICSESNTPEIATRAGLGANPQAVARQAILTVVDTLPADGVAFVPPYVGTTKTIWTTADVNYNLLPGLTTPFDPREVGGAFSGWEIENNPKHSMIRPWVYHGVGGSFSQSLLRPTAHVEWYPAYAAAPISRMAMFVMGDFADVNEKANRLIQYGIYNRAVADMNFGGFAGGAGFGQGYMWPCLFAGLMLGDTDMQNPPEYSDPTNPDPFLAGARKFGEQHQYYYSENALIDYVLPQARELYPNGPPLFGDYDYSNQAQNGFPINHSTRDPNGKYDGFNPNRLDPDYPYAYDVVDENNTVMQEAGAYMRLAVQPIVGCVLASHIMGATALWKNDATVDFIDRWTNDPQMRGSYETNPDSNFHDDIYQFGGTGNEWMKQMWENHRSSF